MKCYRPRSKRKALHRPSSTAEKLMSSYSAGLRKEIQICIRNPRIHKRSYACFEGRYVLTETIHLIDASCGYVTEISSEPPRVEHRPWGTIMTFGVVTRVDDPEGRGRIQVRLPSYEDLETEWIGVVIPGAGPGKGLVALPDLEDMVLVLFAREDPVQAVVLGGLFGSSPLPDTGVEGSQRKRFTLRSSDGREVKLDDKDQRLRIDNGDGSFLELDPDKVCLRSSTDIEISAPGKKITISGAAIDFKKQ